MNQTGVSVTLRGEASSNGSNAAQATLVGMDGGDGDDVLTNYANGHITVVDDEITHDLTASVYTSSIHRGTCRAIREPMAEQRQRPTAYGMAVVQGTILFKMPAQSP